MNAKKERHSTRRWAASSIPIAQTAKTAIANLTNAMRFIQSILDWESLQPSCIGIDARTVHVHLEKCIRCIISLLLTH